jgi:flagellar biosynthesis GTPase FlhF
MKSPAHTGGPFFNKVAKSVAKAKEEAAQAQAALWPAVAQAKAAAQAQAAQAQAAQAQAAQAQAAQAQAAQAAAKAAANAKKAAEELKAAETALAKKQFQNAQELQQMQKKVEVSQLAAQKAVAKTAVAKAAALAGAAAPVALAGAALAAEVLSQDKKEKFNSGVDIISVGVVGLVAIGSGSWQPAAILAAGIFAVKLCLGRPKSGGATKSKQSYKSLSLNLFKSKSISSKKKHIAERVFNTLLKEADLKYPGVIHFSKKIDPDLYNLEVNKLSKILSKNDIINLATNIFGTEIIHRIMKLVNSGENIGLNLTKRLSRSENINNTNETGKNMYKENNYYPPTSIAF